MATVLVIDDEPDLRRLIRFRLECDGHTVLCAPDGSDGLVQALTHVPDLVLLDVMMPGVDGFEVLRRLKKAPRTAKTSVMMLTAKTDYHSEVQAFDLEADSYLFKPFDVNELAHMVQNVLTCRGEAR